MQVIVLWVIVLFQALSIVSTVLMTGRKREPITPGVALATVIVGGGLIAGTFYLAAS